MKTLRCSRRRPPARRRLRPPRQTCAAPRPGLPAPGNPEDPVPRARPPASPAIGAGGSDRRPPPVPEPRRVRGAGLRLRTTEAGADDRTRTGDLVLTKDALYLLSYIGPSSHGRRPAPGRPRAFLAADRRRGASALPAALPHTPELERETGIEPATNSLEGCDSTTELLPPSRLPPVVACAPLRQAGRGRTRLVARGGFEPPKPLGRQIYSLLRLTAPQPRRIPQRWSRNRDTRPKAGAARRTDTGAAAHLANGEITPTPGPTCHVETIRWSWRRDSNPRPADYKSAALPD